MPESAASLWSAWIRGRDAGAFEALVQPELAHVRGFARRLGCNVADADDALQDALAQLARVRDDSPIEVGLRAWMCRVVHTRARSRLRSERRRRAREAAVSVGEAGEASAARVGVAEEVEAALARLGEDEREAVTLRYLHDLEYRDVALVLGLSEGAARQRVHRGVERLRARLGRNAPALVAALPLPALAGAEGVVRAALAASGGAAAGAGSGWALGGFLMASMAGKVTVAAALAVAVGAAAWLLRGNASGGPSTGSEVEALSPGAVGVGGRDNPSGRGAAPGARTGAARGPLLLAGRGMARVGLGALVGRVRDASTTQGLAQATVTLTGQGLGDEAVELHAATDVQGAFRIASVPAGLDFTLRVQAPGLVPLGQGGVVVRADDVVDLGDLWLGLPAPLEGVVLDPDGKGLAGVEVQLHRALASLGEFLEAGGYSDLYARLEREPEPLARTRSQEGGAFRFEGAGAGPVELVVRAAGFRQAVVRLTLLPDVARAPVRVRLAPGATLAGRVVDEAGEGLGGVRVVALSEDGGMPSPLARTFTRSAVDGTFRFTSLAGVGPLRVVAAGEGYPDAFTQAHAGDAHVRVVMRRGATLEVRVVDDGSGAPLAGAQVLVAVGETFRLDDGPGSLVGGLTDASGRVVLEVFPGELQLVIVHAPGMPPTHWDAGGRSAALGQGLKGPAEVRLPAGYSSATFRVLAGVRVAGRVLDLAGAPLAGAEVTSLGVLGAGARTRSAGDGSYELDVALDESSLGVRAHLPGWVQDGAASLEDGRGGARRLDLRMRRAAKVSGRVLDPHGRPVAGAAVSVRRHGRDERFVFDPTTQRLGRRLAGHPRTITRADGTYEVDGVPSEVEVRVFARDDGFVDGWSEAFTVGGDGALAPDVRLLGGANLAVRVQDALGQGVGGALVRVEVEREGSLGADDWESVLEREAGNAVHRTGPTGALELSLLPPGTVTLRISAPGFAPSGAVVTVTPEGGPEEPVTVRMRPGVTVSGRVLDGDGRPLAGALICIASAAGSAPVPGAEAASAASGEERDWIPDWDRSRRATTDALGRWSVTSLPQRPLVAHASKDGYGGSSVALEDVGRPVDLRLVKLDPAVEQRIAEIDRALQALYGRMSVEGETTEILDRLWALQEERQRLRDGSR